MAMASWVILGTSKESNVIVLSITVKSLTDSDINYFVSGYDPHNFAVFSCSLKSTFLHYDQSVFMIIVVSLFSI